MQVLPAQAAAALGADLHFLSASFSKQHPAKTNTGIANADAVEEGLTHLGICDGVSGVHHLGIPPDELPRDLLDSCRAKIHARAGRRSTEADDGTWLTGLIEEAYDSTHVYGATTLLLAVLRASNLVTASLGDCALLVLRPCSVMPLRLRPIFKTEPGRYDSRRPVQVQRLHGFSDLNAHTVIQGAMVSTTPVQHGDILVLGSDGLFDNLRDEDIQLTIERCCGPALAAAACQAPPGPAPSRRRRSQPLAPVPGPTQLQQTAMSLVELAIASVKSDHADPADRAEPWNARGGGVPANNPDDTTALVAVVVSPHAGLGEDEPLESCAGVIDF